MPADWVDLNLVFLISTAILSDELTLRIRNLTTISRICCALKLLPDIDRLVLTFFLIQKLSNQLVEILDCKARLI